MTEFAGLDPEKTARQLELYARDLHQLYESERQKRAELVEERLVLQFRVRELEALNKFVRQHLEDSTRREETYDRVLEQVRKLLQQDGCPAEFKAQLKAALEGLVGEEGPRDQ